MFPFFNWTVKLSLFKSKPKPERVNKSQIENDQVIPAFQITVIIGL